MSKLFADCVVIGGGVTGTAALYYLSKAGMKPVLLEQGNINSGTSGACDEGIILQSKSSGIVLDMVIKSVGLFKTLENELECDMDFKNVGGMILIDSPDHIPVMQEIVKKQQLQGLDIHILDKKDTRTLQPGLSENVISSVYSKNDCRIYPFKLTQGYVSAARRLGANILYHNKVTQIRLSKGKVSKVLADNHEISTPVVIDASGCSSNLIGEMVGLKIPVFPIRGQLVITEQLPVLTGYQIIDSNFIVAKHRPQLVEKGGSKTDVNIGLSMSQAATGNLIIGGCRENAGYDRSVSFKTIRKIIENAANFFPLIKNAKIIRTFAGLRPCTPDNLPILSDTPVKGFFIASGLGGDGLSLSPLAGKITAELVTKGSSSIIDLNQLSFNRFNTC